MALKSGHRVVPLAFEEAQKQYEQFKSYKTGTIRLDPDGWFFTTSFIIFRGQVIYVARDPKDVAVSYCHHSRLLVGHDFLGTTSQFVDHFVNDTLYISQIVHYTSFKEMRKREGDNIMGPDSAIMINSEFQSKEGGFFRKEHFSYWMMDNRNFKFSFDSFMSTAWATGTDVHRFPFSSNTGLKLVFELGITE
ncbi:hypothetical protein Avbf_01807 [Armadillidium vulgare]|nr:hypothetical protein Avbf_01807 [Armadillidium vulgare]